MRKEFSKEDREKAAKVRWNPNNKYKKGNPFLALWHVIFTNTSVRRGRVKVLISWEDIENLYNVQNKKCALTGFEMSLSRKSIYSISIDRIDSTQDYILSNIRLVCKAANMMRGTLSNEELLKFCHGVLQTIRVP